MNRFAFRSSAFAFLVVLAGAGCGNDSGLPVTPNDGAATDAARSPDLAAVPDLATAPDLAAAPDLAPPSAFCRGTRIENTCVATFFAGVQECFRPQGTCKRSFDLADFAVCWQNGATMNASVNILTMAVTSRWSQDAKVCLQADIEIAGQGARFRFQRDGQTLMVDEDTGNTVCPDGSHVSVGRNFGGCPDLEALINPDIEVCRDGACP